MSDGLRAAVMTDAPLAPLWLVGPLAVLALFVVAAHVVLLDRAEMPESRKRIRRVNGLLMMFTLPLAAYAFGVASPARGRQFIMVWMIVGGLVTLVLLLAIIDVANTLRVTLAERRELKRQVDVTRAAARALQGRERAEVVAAMPGERGDGDSER